MTQPHYDGNSIVNLMRSLAAGFGHGSASSLYPVLPDLLPVQVADAHNVVLLVIDGLGDMYVQQGGGSLLDHRCGRMTSVFPTTTATAITTFVTGMAPQQHAITGWFMYLRELGSIAAIMPFRPRWGTSSYSSAGIDTRRILDFKSFFSGINSCCHFIVPASLKDSAYSMAAAGDAMRGGYSGLDDCMTKIEAVVRGSEERKLVYAYWPQFDGLAHQSGIASAAVQEHYQQLDQAFVELLAALAGTDTLVICTADHGLVDCPADCVIHLEEHPELFSCLRLPLCGEPRTAYCYVKPQSLEQFENYVAQHLYDYCDLYRSEDFLESGWFGRGEPGRHLRERIGDYVLLMKPPYIIKDRLIGEPPWTYIGVHGGASEAEMLVPLIAAQL